MKVSKNQNILIFNGDGNLTLSKNECAISIDLWNDNKYTISNKEASFYGLTDYDGKDLSCEVNNFHIYSIYNMKGFWNRIKIVKYVWKWLKENS
jgi:hypothetical protein